MSRPLNAPAIPDHRLKTLEVEIQHVFGIDEPLSIRNRTTLYAQARRAFVYIARHDMALTYHEIGRYIDRDHTTVIAADKRARAAHREGNPRGASGGTIWYRAVERIRTALKTRRGLQPSTLVRTAQVEAWRRTLSAEASAAITLEQWDALRAIIDPERRPRT